MERELRWYDYLTLNSYWFALTTRSQVLSSLVIPLLVQRFVGESVKGSYVGYMRLWALMIALLVQALMGMLSDRSSSRWGRRRPFIVIGTLAEVVVFTLIGLAAGVEGMKGYWVLFALYVLSMISSNTAHAATQGLIPDLVPEHLRGRASGVKALLELPLPLVFTSFVVARLMAQGDLWGGLIATMGVLVACMLATLWVREPPAPGPKEPLNWRPLARLALMTAAFMAVVLALGWGVQSLLALLSHLERGGGQALTALVGVSGMVVAVLLGTWLSIGIGLGEDARNHRAFTWWVTGRLAFMVAANNLSSFMLYFLQERFPALAGEKAAVPAAQVTMVIGIIVMLMALPSGWLADRFGKPRLIVFSSLLAALGIMLLLVVPGMTILYVAGVLVGAAVGIFYTANWALGTELVPREEAGRFLGLSNVAGAGAGAIGAYIGGPIADANGYVVLFTIYGLMFLLTVLAVLAMRRGTAPEAL